MIRLRGVLLPWDALNGEEAVRGFTLEKFFDIQKGAIADPPAVEHLNGTLTLDDKNASRVRWVTGNMHRIL